MTESRRIGVFGGTFDPIHIGHLAPVQDAARQLLLERVLFVPNRQPPHKLTQPVTDVTNRVAMVRLAIEDNPLFEVSLVELERPAPSYTLDTLRELRVRLGSGTQLYFLVGCDALPQLHTWHEPDDLLQEFRLVVMNRPGRPVNWDVIEHRFSGIRDRVEIVDVPQLDISSRDLRRRVRTGRPIRYYVPESVRRYIEDRGLYRETREAGCEP